jgi:hypothetical protein
MNLQFVVTSRFTILQETKKLPILNRTSLKHVTFIRKHKDKQFFFCENNTLTDVFVTQPTNNAEICFTIRVTCDKLPISNLSALCN